MSIYIMTVGELAKKRGEPVGDFVKKVQSLGFEAGSHAKKLTQKDLDTLIELLDPPKILKSIDEQPQDEITIENPNVLIVSLPNGKRSILLVDALINSNGSLDLKIITQTVEDSLGEALLEFRKQMGMHMGVN
jgi:hypothetical protein